MRGIYKIKNKINEKIYIGETLDIVRRWTEHRTLLKENKHYNWKLQQDYNTYGEESFEYSIVTVLDESIKDYIDKYILLYYETYYIIEHNSIENGYNLELTLSEILKGNKNIYDEKDIGVIKSVKKQIEQGVIISANGIIYRDVEKGEQIKKEKKEKKKIRNIIPIEVEECILKDNSDCIKLKDVCDTYDMKCTYNEMFSLFREKGIFEYRYIDNKKQNIPCGKFKKLFQLKEVKYKKGLGLVLVIKKENLKIFEKLLNKLELINN